MCSASRLGFSPSRMHASVGQARCCPAARARFPKMFLGGCWPWTLCPPYASLLSLSSPSTWHTLGGGGRNNPPSLAVHKFHKATQWGRPRLFARMIRPATVAPFGKVESQFRRRASRWPIVPAQACRTCGLSGSVPAADERLQPGALRGALRIHTAICERPRALPAQSVRGSVSSAGKRSLL